VSIGKTLEAARTAAGMSVEQVSEATRVRQTLVRQIEDDDFSQCGGDFYARGHVRNIAHAIGIDPAPLVAEFDQQHSASAHAPRAAQVFEPESVRAERRGPNWSAAMVLALAVVCIYGLVQLFTPDNNEPREDEPIAGTGTESSQEPRTPAPTPTTASPTPSPTEGNGAVATVPRDKVTVRVIGISRVSWMSATGSGGKQLFEGNVRRGQVEDFTDKKLVRLVIGNAGAIKLIVNGKDLGAPGEDGEVIRRLQFGPGDPEAAG
jgi:cytoskeletal protein RodZ